METVESPMYAKVITRHSGNSTLNPTPAPEPFSGSSAAGAGSPSAYHRLPTSAAGSNTTMTGRYDTNSAKSQRAPTHASEAPRIPPRLYAA